MRKERAIRQEFLLFFVIVALMFAGLRFIHLEADLPPGIDWSSDLYTDEGWYANAAARAVLGHSWYLPGDFNPAVTLPVGQLLQCVMFRLLGMGIFSARLTDAIAFFLMVLLTGRLIQRGSDKISAALAMLLIACNPIAFAYGHVAIMEPIGLSFVAAALLAVQQGRHRNAPAFLILASLLASAAILTKETMIFVVPLIAYLGWRNGTGKRQRIAFAAACLVLPGLLVGGWQLGARHCFPADYAYFHAINLSARRVSGFQAWARNVGYQAKNMLVLGKLFLGVALSFTLLALLVSRRFRKMPLVHLLGGYAIGYFIILSLVKYGPPRYFLPLIVPLGGLTAIAATQLTRSIRATQHLWSAAAAPSLVIMAMVVLDGARILRWVEHPHYSFVTMTGGVGEIIGRREPKTAAVALLGDMADSVALQTGALQARLLALNSHLGTLSLRDRLERYRPGYVIIHTDDDVLGSIHALGGQVTKLGSWSVFENYYGTGQSVRLFSVGWGKRAGTGSGP